MILKEIKLLNFRNLKGSYTLDNHLNLIVARNGAGKTNFVEALSLLSSGKSFRTNKEVHTLRKEGEADVQPVLRIEGEISDSLGNSTIRAVVIEKVSDNGIRKTLKVNGSNKRISNFISGYPCIVFSPNSVDLVLGTPSERRRDLDGFLCLLDDEYYSTLSDYKKVIRNRNRIIDMIRKQDAKIEELSYWNHQMVEAGSKIIHSRILFIQDIKEILDKLASELFRKANILLELKYETKISSSNDLQKIQDRFKAKVRQNLNKEIAAGVSLYGPHRDDLRFLSNGQDLKEYGSRGRQRVCIFIYKLAQWYFLNKKRSINSLLLLDDLFSEIDKDTSSNIEKYLKKHRSQIVITAVNKQDISSDFVDGANEIKLIR